MGTDARAIATFRRAAAVTLGAILGLSAVGDARANAAAVSWAAGVAPGPPRSWASAARRRPPARGSR